MTPEYWAEEKPGPHIRYVVNAVTLEEETVTSGTETEIHCRLGLAHMVAVVDGTADEVYNLPAEVLDAIKDRLYAICVERLEEKSRART